jgi:pimeloyl-ACP methyl ester carboxylesterase
VGSALLEALETVFQISRKSRRRVILGGHDRGARICHRLVVDKDDFPNLEVIGTILLDIVPTKVQWEAFANPKIAVGYFHWPFLANLA